MSVSETAITKVHAQCGSVTRVVGCNSMTCSSISPFCAQWVPFEYYI
jgi:hypothetical protein